MAKAKLIKILIPAAVALAVAGIWLAKNAADNRRSEDQATPLEITEVNLEELKAHSLPIVIDFGADTCVPCQQMAPVLVKMNSEMQGKALIHFVNLAENPDAARDFPVRVIPTQIFFLPDGKPYVPDGNSGISFIMYADRETNEHLFTVHEGGLTEEQMRAILEDMGAE